MDLKAELKARGHPVTGLKIDLKKRLSKIIQQEKVKHILREKILEQII